MLIDGAATIKQIRDQTDTILLSFSCGKDSIAAWLECRKHFPHIIPFYLYLVPDLQFVNDALAYYEDWFGCRIAQYPHPSLYRMLNNCVFQSPEHRQTIARAGLPKFDYGDIEGIVREKHGVPGAYCATGVRAVDSPYRMAAMKKHGPINAKTLKFHPIWDWNMDRLVTEIEGSGAKLPIDYRLFGRSFDGIDYRFLEPIRRELPEDYFRILEYFPLAELEMKRREYAAA